MTDFLIINSQTVPVAEGTFKENPLERGGTESRAYAGNLRSTIRWTKRSWSCTTGHMLKSAGETLKAAINALTGVTISGSAIPGGTYLVTLGDTIYVTCETSDDNNWVMQYTLTIRQI